MAIILAFLVLWADLISSVDFLRSLAAARKERRKSHNILGIIFCQRQCGRRYFRCCPERFGQFSEVLSNTTQRLRTLYVLLNRRDCFASGSRAVSTSEVSSAAGHFCGTGDELHSCHFELKHAIDRMHIRRQKCRISAAMVNKKKRPAALRPLTRNREERAQRIELQRPRGGIPH